MDEKEGAADDLEHNKEVQNLIFLHLHLQLCSCSPCWGAHKEEQTGSTYQSCYLVPCVIFFVCVALSCMFQTFLCSSTPYSNKWFIIVPKINDTTDFLGFFRNNYSETGVKIQAMLIKLLDLTVFYGNKRHIYSMSIFSQREYDNLKTILLWVCRLWKCRIWKVGK